jgi:XRE family transcriptional regulator of biofilm formation
MNTETLARRLTELRERDGLSLAELAEKAEVSRAFVWKLENGKTERPSYDLLRKLAMTLDVSVAYLAGDEMRP